MGQRYGFSIAVTAGAEAAGVSLHALHTDIDAICRAHDALVPLAERLGVDPPQPGLAGLAYCHVSTVGCEVVISSESVEPWVRPCISDPADIDDLAEPDDYLAAGVVPERLALAERLKAVRPDASTGIGHDYEGPVTTAVLMMGQGFFTLPFDDPARAHRLMEFVTRSAVNYARTLRAHQGRPVGGGRQGICDDFAGMFGPEQFAEFAAPYWEMMYQGLEAESRGMHSELLREQHMGFLAAAAIDEYDPSVDQYLTPETLERSCPVPYTLRMWPSEVRDHSAEELVEMYRYRASFEPVSISFALSCLSEEEKAAALLEVARGLA